MKQRRIKEVIDSSGKSKFFPQWKFLWWWMNFGSGSGRFPGAIWFHTLEDCKKRFYYKECKEVRFHEIGKDDA